MEFQGIIRRFKSSWSSLPVLQNRIIVIRIRIQDVKKFVTDPDLHLDPG